MPCPPQDLGTLALLSNFAHPPPARTRAADRRICFLPCFDPCACLWISLCLSGKSLLLRLDILVHTEEIRRIVFLLDPRQLLVILPVLRLDTPLALFHHEIHVRAAA